MTKKPHGPLALVILDGFGYRESTEHNAIAAAKTPCWDDLWQNQPHTLISGSGQSVGLPDNQMGNSEVGHLNIGAGRIVYQDLSRIDHAIETKELEQNTVLLDAIHQTKQNGSALHIMGLLSPGGVHSHESHFHALLSLAADHKVNQVYAHAFLDGRDTPPKSAASSIHDLEQHCKALGNTHIASLIGRYYAMDRDKRWERIEKAYDLLVNAKADYIVDSALDGLEQAYQRGETDEFVKATSIKEPNGNQARMKDGDTLIFINFRADRARELTQAFIDPDFNGFKREQNPKLSSFVCLSQYDANFPAPVAFPPISLNNLLAECISNAGLKQLRIAETEKYAHVTFFFNGGIEKPFDREDRILIPSPKVATYDLQPEMNAPELCDRLVNEIKHNDYDVIICNFANPDMVGHTGNLKATIKAIECIDSCIEKIKNAIIESNGELIITADHGNAEKMFNPDTNQAHTAHTSDPVPFVYLGKNAEIDHINGKLSDIAPTMLYLLGLEIPSEMTGTPLLKLL